MGQIVRKLRWRGSQPLCYANTLPTALPPEMLFLDFLNHRDLEMCRQLSSEMNKEILRHRHLFNARATFQMLQIKLLAEALTIKQDGSLDGRRLGGRNSWTDISRATMCCRPLKRQIRDTASFVGHRIFIGAPSDRIVWLEVLNIGGNDRSAARIKQDAVVLAIRNELNATTAPTFFHFLKHLDGARFLDANVQRAQQHASARLDRAVFQFTAAFSPREVELHCRPGRERLASLSNDVRLDLSAILRLVVGQPSQAQDAEDDEDA